MLQLIPFTTKDIDSLTYHANNIKIAALLTNKFPFPYSKEEAAKFIKYTQTFTLPEILAISFSNEVIGAIGLHPQKDIYSKTIELGYWIGEDYWNKGIATKAVKLGIEYALQNWDFNKIVAKVFDKNISSQKVLLKNNFVKEATLTNAIFKNGTFYDEHIYCYYNPKFA